MPRLYGTVDILTFDSKGYTATLRKGLEVQFRQAARAFIRAAIPLIPVQTGMARGSFLNIGRYLRVAVPINPTKFNQQYFPPRGGDPIPKTPESGAALSTSPDQIIRWEGDRISFEFQSGVFHLTLEDLIGVRSPTAPWHSFITGRLAFHNELRNLRNRLPKIKSFVTRTSITFGRGSTIRKTPIRLRQQEKVGD